MKEEILGIACNDHYCHVVTQHPWLLLISCLGFLVSLKYCISVVRWVLKIIFLRAEKDLKRSYGSWALITGATDGIGKAFAYQLAHRGLNLILVSRTSSKLETVSHEILASFPKIQIKTIQTDFSGDHSAALRQIKEATHNLDLGILINNVGVTWPARFFHEVEEHVWMNIVRVNLESTTMVTKAVLPGMLQRRRGAIVNIGSGAAVVVPSHPLSTVYAATKAYINQLSRSLFGEYQHHGIHVQCQVPLYVATKMGCKVARIERASLFVPSAEDYARCAIRHIGHEPQCSPYWSHSLQWCLARLLPDFFLDAWRLSIGIRRRALSLSPSPNQL